jgi:hypothetical protein
MCDAEDVNVLNSDFIKYVDGNGIERDLLTNGNEYGELTDYLKAVSKRNSKHLKVAHINAQSLNNDMHFTMFHEHFVGSGINIIAVSETFFKGDSKMDLPGYRVFHVNRTDLNGGGVALYLIDNLQAKVLATSNGLSTEPEYLILEVKSADVVFVVSVVYRRPKNGYLDNYLNELYLHLPRYKYSIICGDFNARLGSGSFETAIIEEMFQLCDHSILPHGKTYHVNECHSALDIIASNMNELLIEYGKVAAPSFSHHDLLYAVFQINTSPPVAKYVTYRNFKKLDQVKLFEDVEKVSWVSVHESDNIDGKVEAFNSIILGLLEKHVPIKRVRIKHHSAPWFTSDIRASLRSRNRARKKYLKTGTSTDFATYRDLRNKVKQMIRQSKVNYYHSIFDASQTSEKLWKNIKSLGIGKRGQDNRTSDFPVTANELNEHYLSVSNIDDTDLAIQTQNFYSDLPFPPGEPFHFLYVTSDDIVKAVMSISSNAIGLDLIPVLFLKLVLSRVVFVIEYIFNFSLQHGVFPTVWKSANILPIPKVKNPTVCKDFRPISILCVLSKAFEKLVHSQIYHYALTSGIINPFQSGFRKKHSTMSALVKVVDDIRKNIDKREMTALVLLDFTKAFDRVNHNLLLIKLSKLGFSSSVIEWLRNYLSDRYQRVFCDDNFKSDWALVTAGVPQGSVLGPLLFILYLHDISSVIKYCSYHLYADDVQIYISFTITNIAAAITKISEDLDRLVTYIAQHNLALNVAKTQPIIIGSERYVQNLSMTDVPKIRLSNTLVPYCTTVNNLGVIIDNTLSWKPHVISTVGKVFGALAQVRRNFCYLPKSIRLRIVQSLIMPLIDYGSVIFTNMSKENCLKLQRAENACIRFVTNTSRFDHITPSYVELQLLKVEDRRALNVAIMMWKLFKFQCPSYLYDMFSTHRSVQTCSTRTSPDTLVIPVHRTAIYSNSFCITAIRAYNFYKIYLYLHLSSAISLKKCVKNHLMSLYI